MTLSVEQISEITKMIGVVAAGLWAAWTFHKLQKARAAELDNNTKLAGIRRSNIEHEELRTQLLRQQPQLEIDLNVAEAEPMREGDKSSLCVTVVLKNKGQQNLQCDFLPYSLTIGRVVFDDNGEHSFSISSSPPIWFIPGSNQPEFFDQRILRVGDQRKMALQVLPIQAPGPYFVQFHTVYRKYPFDGQKQFRKEPVQVNAVEQTIYFATGKPAGVI
jgi:hypothetical protein